MTYKAVFFDLDGTLVDSVPDLARATNAMLAELDLPQRSMEALTSYVGKGSDMLIKRALAGDIQPNEPDPILFEQAKHLFKKYYHLYNGQQSIVYSGVFEGLTRLKEMGLSLAVVTNKPQEFTLILLEQTKLQPFFKVITSGDTCSRKKPYPDQLLYTCKQLALSPHEVVFVGDSINDAQAADAANMDFLVLPYGYNEGNSVQTLKVNAIVQDINQVADWINQRVST
ncbi:phosphoglycolate phosphatase [Pelistega indica]|uniref:Phosphoglycolate phosphatase n=1 Tax=Pelistega indica TaxID=1414851 RepID=V8G2I3_9BURK|nr:MULTISPECIES: phosphoglycolate phosphatase [Pelistega]ETD69887.1 phosphoglycolate phosphatase [Pelistega indica]